MVVIKKRKADAFRDTVRKVAVVPLLSIALATGCVSNKPQSSPAPAINYEVWQNGMMDRYQARIDGLTETITNPESDLRKEITLIQDTRLGAVRSWAEMPYRTRVSYPNTFLWRMYNKNDPTDKYLHSLFNLYNNRLAEDNKRLDYLKTELARDNNTMKEYLDNAPLETLKEHREKLIRTDAEIESKLKTDWNFIISYKPNNNSVTIRKEEEEELTKAIESR